MSRGDSPAGVDSQNKHSIELVNVFKQPTTTTKYQVKFVICMPIFKDMVNEKFR